MTKTFSIAFTQEEVERLERCSLHYKHIYRASDKPNVVELLRKVTLEYLDEFEMEEHHDSEPICQDRR